METPRSREERERQAQMEELRRESAALAAAQVIAERRHEMEHAAFLAGLRADLKAWTDEQV
jgi:hypothetical protein